MREFKLSLQKPMMRGLKPRDVSAINTGTLIRCLGMRVREVGLERVSSIHDPTGLTVSWPTPQIFQGREHTFVCDSDAVYVKASDSWTLTEIAAVSSGGAWHFADLGDFCMFFNGATMVLRTPSTVYTFDSDPTIGTGCAYKGGRVIWAGLSSDFWSAAWRTLLTAEADWIASGLSKDFDFTGNTVFWGAIGGGDTMLWLTEPTSSSLPIVGPLGAGYGYDSDKPFYRDFLRRGDVGWGKVGWSGNVLRVKPLGDAILVYGTNGVSALTPFSTGFGEKVLLREIGLIGRGAIEGDEYVEGVDSPGHVFVGTDSALYRVDANLKVQRLDYSGYLSDDQDSGTVVAFDRTEREWYVGGPSGGYVLTKGGLSQVVRPPSSVLRTASGLYGTPTLVSNAADRIEVEWDTFNFDMRGVKQIVNVQVDYYGIDNIRVELACATEVNKIPTYRAVGRDNGHGVFFFGPAGLAGDTFRLKITGDPQPEATINDVIVRVVSLDGRFARGTLELGGDSADASA